MSGDYYRSMCNKCLRPTKACFCEEIVSFATQFEFRILMHPKEAKYSHIGTGRMANLVLNNCQIIVGATFDNDPQVQKLIHAKEYFPMVLYPGENAINISRQSLAKDYFQNKKPLIFI